MEQTTNQSADESGWGLVPLESPFIEDYERRKIRAKKYSPKKHLNR